MWTSCVCRAPHQSVSADVAGRKDPTAQPPQRPVIQSTAHEPAGSSASCAPRVAPLVRRSFLSRKARYMLPARSPSRESCILRPSCVLRARLRTLRRDHMTVCPPRRAPRRSLRAAGAPCLTPRHSAPRVSRSLVTHTSRCRYPSPMSSLPISARFATARRVPTPAPRSRLDAALPLGRARFPRG